MKFLKTLALAAFLSLVPLKTKAREDSEIMEIKFERKSNLVDKLIYNFEAETENSVQWHTRYHNIKDRAWLLEEDKFWARENTFQTSYILQSKYGILNSHNDSLNLLTKDLNDALYITLKDDISPISNIMNIYEKAIRFNFDPKNKKYLEIEESDELVNYYRSRRSFLSISGGVGIGTPSLAKSNIELDKFLNPYAYISGFNSLMVGSVSTTGNFTLSSRLYLDDIAKMPKLLKRSYIAYSYSSNFKNNNHRHQFQIKLNRVSLAYRVDFIDEKRYDTFTASLTFLW